jgi:RES domain-containing protein
VIRLRHDVLIPVKSDAKRAIDADAVYALNTIGAAVARTRGEAGRAKTDEFYRFLLVPGERIELPTNGLQNRCSTAELTRLRVKELSASLRCHKPDRGGRLPESRLTRPIRQSR